MRVIRVIRVIKVTGDFGIRVTKFGWINRVIRVIGVVRVGTSWMK